MFIIYYKKDEFDSHTRCHFLHNQSLVLFQSNRTIEAKPFLTKKATSVDN